MPATDQVQRNLEMSYPWLLVRLLYLETSPCIVNRAEKEKNHSLKQAIRSPLALALYCCSQPPYILL